MLFGNMGGPSCDPGFGEAGLDNPGKGEVGLDGVKLKKDMVMLLQRFLSRFGRRRTYCFSILHWQAHLPLALLLNKKRIELKVLMSL